MSENKTDRTVSAGVQEQHPPRWLVEARARIASEEPLRVGSDLHLLEMAADAYEQAVTSQQEVVSRAVDLARGGHIAELQELTNDTHGPAGYIFGAWLNLACAWGDLDEARTTIDVEGKRSGFRERALLELLRYFCNFYDVRELSYDCPASRSAKRLNTWLSKPLVDDNGLGPDGVCLQCAAASATDHATTCVFRLEATKVVSSIRAQQGVDRVRELEELLEREKDGTAAEVQHLADLLKCEAKFGPVGHAIERVMEALSDRRAQNADLVREFAADQWKKWDALAKSEERVKQAEQRAEQLESERERLSLDLRAAVVLREQVEARLAELTKRSDTTPKFNNFVEQAQNLEFGYGDPCLVIPCPRCDGTLTHVGFNRAETIAFIQCYDVCKLTYTVKVASNTETP